MKIQIENLGSIKQAEFELGDFTIICGTNNTGKTYATYALFGFLHNWKKLLTIAIDDALINNLLNKGLINIDLMGYDYQLILQEGSEKYTQSLPTIFSAPKEHFHTTKFKIILDEKPALQTLNPAQITPESGIEAHSFDATINTMNRIQEAIIWK